MILNNELTARDIEPNPKIGLIYNLCLFLLCFTYSLSTIYFFSTNTTVNIINLAAQLISYPILVMLTIDAGYSVKEYIIIFLVITIFLLEFYFNRSTSWLRYLLLILASRKVKFDDILRTLLISFSTIFLIGFFLYLMGISDAGIGRRNGISFGFIEPNTVSMIIITIIFLILCLQKRLKVSSLVMILVTIIFVNIFTKTQTAALVLILLPFLYLWVKRGIDKDKSFSKFIMKAFQILVMIFTCLLLYLYPQAIFNPFRNIVDGFFSYRPYLNYNNFVKYGLSLFGQKIDFFDTANLAYNYLTGSLSNQRYNTVDSAYVTQLLTIGIITIIPIYMAYIQLIKKAIKNKRYMLITVAILCSCYAFLENNYNEAYYFFPYFYLLSADVKSKSEKKDLVTRRFDNA